MHIELDPQLLEEVVFLEIRRREQSGDQAIYQDYRDRVDSLYDAVIGVDALYGGDDEDRDIAFRDVHGEFFDRLGFGRMIRDLLDEFPLLQQHLDQITCSKAVSRKQEGADLFVRRHDGGGRLHRTAMLRLRAEIFLDAGQFHILLRQELYHVSDMLDPAFGYEPDLGDTGESTAQENLIRDRYRVLWELYIDARLVRAGRTPTAFLERRQSLLRKAFESVSDENNSAIFKTVSNAESLTHADLLELAKA
jgi:hypothetical protein